MLYVWSLRLRSSQPLSASVVRLRSVRGGPANIDTQFAAVKGSHSVVMLKQIVAIVAQKRRTQHGTL